MRAFLAVLVLALALAGCAEEEAATVQEESASPAAEAPATDPTLYRTDGIAPEFMPWVQEGADMVCEITGTCFEFAEDGGSLVQSGVLVDYSGYAWVDGDGSFRILLTESLFLGPEDWRMHVLRRVAAHEFGHAAGLEHVCDAMDIMYAPQDC